MSVKVIGESAVERHRETINILRVIINDNHISLRALLRNTQQRINVCGQLIKSIGGSGPVNRAKGIGAGGKIAVTIAAAWCDIIGNTRSRKAIGRKIPGLRSACVAFVKSRSAYIMGAYRPAG